MISCISFSASSGLNAANQYNGARPGASRPLIRYHCAAYAHYHIFVQGRAGAATLEYRGRCPECGQPNRESARYCAECGASLGDPSQQPPAGSDPLATTGSIPPTAPVSETPATPGTGPSGSAADGPAQRRGPRFQLPRRGVAIPLAGVAVAGLVALIGWQADWPPVVFGSKLVSSTVPSPHPSAAQPGPSPRSQTPTLAAPTSVSPSSPAPSASPAGTGLRGPAATVRAYFAAINAKQYAAAWRRGGKNTGVSYHAFISGFASTASDTLTVISVSGNSVTAQVAARQVDGTIKTYQGSYTVSGGVITQFNVQQTS